MEPSTTSCEDVDQPLLCAILSLLPPSCYSSVRATCRLWRDTLHSIPLRLHPKVWPQALPVVQRLSAAGASVVALRIEDTNRFEDNVTGTMCDTCGGLLRGLSDLDLHVDASAARVPTLLALCCRLTHLTSNKALNEDLCSSLSTITSLRSLSLFHGSVLSWPILAGLEHKQLTALKISYMTQMGAPAMQSVRRLQLQQVYGSSTLWNTVQYFACMPQLQHLEVVNCDSYEELPPSLFNTLPHLLTLHWTGTAVTAGRLRLQLQRAPDNHPLRELTLSMAHGVVLEMLVCPLPRKLLRLVPHLGGGRRGFAFMQPMSASSLDSETCELAQQLRERGVQVLLEAEVE